VAYEKDEERDADVLEDQVESSFTGHDQLSSIESCCCWGLKLGVFDEEEIEEEVRKRIAGQRRRKEGRGRCKEVLRWWLFGLTNVVGCCNVEVEVGRERKEGVVADSKEERRK
jgi:hypothetical protein